MDIREYKKYVGYALGEKKPSIVLKNANVIMVQSCEIIKADIAIEGEYIVGVGEYDGEKNIDMSGKFISPGFIDSHLHFESTMANPDELVHYASISGTTTFIADPHEAANVSGIEGIKFILDSTENSTADVYIMMPSCVPCKRGEDSGYIIDANEMEKLYGNERVLGLAELMDIGAVIGLEDDMMKKLDMYKHKVKDGHAPGLDDKTLSAYAMADILTDHECTTFEYAMKEIRNGMIVHIREGSAAKNLEAIVSGIVRTGVDTSQFTFCTDDKHLEDIEREGHVSFNVKKAISLGLDPLRAYQMVTINSSRVYSLNDRGIIAPGKIASLVILDDYKNVDINSVMYRGKFIDKEYKYDDTIEKKYSNLKNTVHIDWFDKSMLEYKSNRHAIQLIGNQILTKKIDLNQYSNKEDIEEILGVENKAVVIERHKNTKKYHVAKVFGFGIRGGAIASSVSHDSHNIVVIGDNDDDIMIAIEKIKDLQGGYVLVENKEVFEYLSMPIMGLISDKRSKQLSHRVHKMVDRAHQMGVKDDIEPFITLSFIALPVIPSIRITTNGLYDVSEDIFLD